MYNEVFFRSLTAAKRMMTTLLWWKHGGWPSSPTPLKPAKPPKRVQVIEICQSGNKRLTLRHFSMPVQGPSRHCGSQIQAASWWSSSAVWHHTHTQCPQLPLPLPTRQWDYPGWPWVAALRGVGLLVLTINQCPSLRNQQKSQQPYPIQPPLP